MDIETIINYHDHLNQAFVFIGLMNRTNTLTF